MRKIFPVLNETKDMSAAHAFREDRPLPRAAMEELGYDIPHGSHPDDDMFLQRDQEGGA